MNRTALLIAVVALAGPAGAGGLNRLGGLGPRAGAMSGAYTAIADDASLFYYNPAGLVQFGTAYADFGSDVILPRFKINGYQSANDQAYALPLAGLVKPIGDDWAIGLGLTVPYGLGAKFDGSWPNRIWSSDSRLSLTNFTPALAVRLTDKLAVGIGLNIGYAQLDYRAPLDIGGHFLPLSTDSQADGWGLGGIIGLRYQATERLTLGLTYMSGLTADLNGKAKIGPGPLALTGRFDSEFTFPAKLGFGLAYQTDRWLLSFDANWFGYSRAVKELKLNFTGLPLTKTTALNWQDNYSFHFGVRRQLSNHWLISGGLGYMSKAIPDQTISQLTPDVSGWDVSAGLEYQRNHLSLNALLIYSWGQNNVAAGWDVAHPGKYEAETLTVGFTVNWQF